jgi:proteic killer suppression protein
LCYAQFREAGKSGCGKMIKSFGCKETRKIFAGVFSRKFPADIQTRAFNKLAALHAALELTDLRAPPSNHLEELKGDRVGQYSIRINDKYRICFYWSDNNAENVEMVDYHD